MSDHMDRTLGLGYVKGTVILLTILFSNTLGTALGDFLADSSGLGFGGGALLISSLIGLTVIAHFYSRISKVLLFWAAFVLTRPFGATMGDLLTKPHVKGGLDFGTVGSSAVLAVILGVFILHSIRNEKKEARVTTAPDFDLLENEMKGK